MQFANTLARNPGQWNVILVGSNNGSNVVQGGTLNPVPFPNGPHPYTNDFYYAYSIAQLPAGRTWTAYINLNANCSPAQIGFFST